MAATAFPLTWPDNMPRTKVRAKSLFRTSMSGALKNVRTSLSLFGRDSGKKVDTVVISSNVTLGIENPSDPGVAVWFVWDGLSVCIAIDRYPKVEHNLQAIHLVIEARRTELRHGGLYIVRAAFMGFQALPAPTGQRKRHWRDVLEFQPHDRPEKSTIELRFRELAKRRHPDTGGSTEAMAELSVARDAALEELK